MIKTFFAYFLTIPFLFLWFLFCFCLSLFGILVRKTSIEIDLENVKKKETICSVLNSKRLLTNEQYKFETQDVASLYDELTFKGYLFVLKPVIFILKHFSFADTFILYLVHKWMNLHHYKIKYNRNAKTFFSFFMSLCVMLAFYLGQFLYLIKK